MIELTPEFKEAIKSGPLKYLIQISEDDGISWQDLPSGAEAHSPLGDISGETETEPFQFVGADCEITCNNANGFWTNSAKTGKLDTGYAIKFRLKIAPDAIDNEWAQLIEGYIDLASVTNYRTEYTCVFTVRGCLNVLDSVLANFVLADRPATYPHKFGGWLKITGISSAHPEGLYPLSCQIEPLTLETQISPGSWVTKPFETYKIIVNWNYGKNTELEIINSVGQEFEVTGQDGNTITVSFNQELSDTNNVPEFKPSSGTIEQYIAIKKVSNIPTAYQTRPSGSLAWLKEKVYKYTDLDIANVSAYPAITTNPAIAHYSPVWADDDRLYVSHVVGISPKRWLVCSWKGDYQGAYLAQTKNDTSYGVEYVLKTLPDVITSSHYVVNSYVTDNYIYLLCETGATPTFKYTPYLGYWVVVRVDRTTLANPQVFTGAGYVYWRSFAGISDTEFYIVKKDSSTTGKLTKCAYTPGSLVYTELSNSFSIRGPALMPGIIHFKQQYIVCNAVFQYPAAGFMPDKVNHYLQIYDITEAVSETQVLDLQTEINHIEYCKTVSSLASIGVDGYPGIGLVLSKNVYSSKYGDTVFYRHSGENEVYGYVIYPNQYFNILYNQYILIANSDTTKIWTAYIDETITDKTIYFYNGNNVGESRTITGQVTTIVMINNVRKIITILTLSSALPHTETSGDDFLIYDQDQASIDSGGITRKTTISGADVLRPMWGTYAGWFYPECLVIGTENVKQFIVNGEDELFSANLGPLPFIQDACVNYDTVYTEACIATSQALIFVRFLSDNIYPELHNADFDDKTLREAIQEVAISANCHLMPSEHNKRLSLIYRGKAANPQFTLSNTEYKQGPRSTPYFNYDAVDVNGKRAGVFSAGNKQRDLSLTTQCTPDAYAQSLAYDILKHIGSGDRTHEIQAVGRVELEPGDEGYLELEDGTTKQAMILGHTTNPETLDRSMIIREF